MKFTVWMSRLTSTTFKLPLTQKRRRQAGYDGATLAGLHESLLGQIGDSPEIVAKA
jgi:hypothetical protein